MALASPGPHRDRAGVWPVIPYASRTGTRRNLALLRAAGWRLFVSAKGVLRTEGFPYALDNGAWSAFTQGEDFDVEAFEKAFDLLGAGADFVIVPDIVAGGRSSLDLSLSWMDRLAPARKLLIPNQDGLVPADFADLVSERVGIFHGGSTEWKIETMVEWGRWCAERDVYFHVGRVNTGPRFRLAHVAGACSVDGSSASRFAVNIPMLDGLARQDDLFDARRMVRA